MKTADETNRVERTLLPQVENYLSKSLLEDPVLPELRSDRYLRCQSVV